MNNCAIVISTHKESLDNDELKSLKRCIDLYINKYDIFINTKKSNDISFYLKLNDKLKIQKQDDLFFSSYFNCANMHRSKEYYSSFLQYEYILTRQLDVWDIYDNLEYFINLKYDYYGAPVVNCPTWGSFAEIVGCGGCALRKVQKFYSICESFYDFYKLKFIDEDVYFSRYCNDKLNICPVNIGLQFCFSAEKRSTYEYWLNKTNGKIPAFVHMYKKYNETWDFWRKYIYEQYRKY